MNEAIKAHATRLIEAQCDMLCRARRNAGFAYPDEMRATDERGVFLRVKKDLKDSGLYGNLALWWFLFSTLRQLVIDIIRRRQEREA